MVSTPGTQMLTPRHVHAGPRHTDAGRSNQRSNQRSKRGPCELCDLRTHLAIRIRYGVPCVRRPTDGRDNPGRRAEPLREAP